LYSFSVTDHLRESEKQTFGENIMGYLGTAALFVVLTVTFFLVLESVESKSP